MSTIVAIGTVNALVFAILVRAKKEKVLPDRLLSLYFLAAAAAFGLVFAAQEWGQDWLLLPLQYGNLFWAPMFYIYVWSMTDPGHRMPRVWPLHFVLLLLATFYQFTMLLTLSETEITLLFRVRVFSDRPLLFNVLYLVDLVSVPVYLAWSWRLIRAHRRRIKDLYSYRQSVDYRWLTRFIVAGAVSWAVLDLPYLGTFLVGGLNENQALAIGIVVNVVLTIYIGICAVRQNSVYADMAGFGGEEPTEGMADTSDRRYRKSGMDAADLQSSLTQLVEFMETERPYLDNSLTIRDLAGAVGLTEHNLSEVLNVGLGKRFYDFVNGYRVEEFKRRAVRPESANLTLLAIALQCGFNSKSSFNRIFKQHMGVTPSMYLKSARAASPR